MICIQLIDPTEIQIPDLGLIKLHDVETGESFWVDSSYKKATIQMRKNLENKIKIRNLFFNKNGIDHILINTQNSYIKPLISFFNQRTSRH